jgi:hypothetical protein
MLSTTTHLLICTRFLRTASAFQHSVFQFKHALIEKVKAGFNEQNKKILYLKFYLFKKTVILTARRKSVRFSCCVRNSIA